MKDEIVSLSVKNLNILTIKKNIKVWKCENYGNLKFGQNLKWFNWL